MKAYNVWHKDGEDSTVVFAESRNEAKVIAMGCDCCEGSEYIDISAKRMKALDGLYKGKPEIDWYDTETRKILVRDYGWACCETSWECDNCEAREYCQHWEDEE